MRKQLSSGLRTVRAEHRPGRVGIESLALSLQRAAGNRAVSSLLGGAGSPHDLARDRRLRAVAAATASVQRAPTRVGFIDPSQYERGDKPPGSKEPATMDPSTAPLPVADFDPKVAVDDDDKQECTLKPRSLVHGSPSYIDNGMVSVGADITDVWTIGIQALVFKTKAGSDVRVPLEAIDFDETTPPARYVTRGGVTYPLRADGSIAYNQMSTPTILRGALMKLQQQEQLRGERLEIAQVVMAFQFALANLASAVAPNRIAASFEGVAPQVAKLERAGGARAGIGASGKGGKEAWFNPRGLRDNCVGGVCSVIKTSSDRKLVTEAEIAQKFGETSRKLSGKSLNLAKAREFIRKSTGKTLSDTAVTLDQKGLQPGAYVAFGGQSTATLEHVVYATVKADGRVVIYDPQIATKWSWFRFVGRYGRGSRAYRILNE